MFSSVKQMLEVISLRCVTEVNVIIPTYFHTQIHCGQGVVWLVHRHVLLDVCEACRLWFARPYSYMYN